MLGYFILTQSWLVVKLASRGCYPLQALLISASGSSFRLPIIASEWLSKLRKMSYYLSIMPGDRVGGLWLLLG